MRCLISCVTILAASFGTAAQVRTDFDRRMNQPVKPFRIIGNIYYVGASDVTVFLITTEQGHILIDGGFRETVPQIEANVRALGFDLKDIKILLNNHAHYDHAGGLALLKQKTGASLYASTKQKIQLENGGRHDFAYGDTLPFDPVKVDRQITDLERITLGKTTVVAHFTPGHTKGCTSFTTEATYRDASYAAIFLCSTTALNYDLIDNKNYINISQDFRSTFKKLRSVNVDIFLASHASFFKMSRKREKAENAAGRNPFLDPAGYLDFIDVTERAFEEKYERQKSAAIKK